MDLGAQERAERLAAATRRLRQLADEVDRITQGIESDTNTRLREFRRFAEQGASDLRTAARIVGGEVARETGRPGFDAASLTAGLPGREGPGPASIGSAE